jgi:hypothetical protein
VDLDDGVVDVEEHATVGVGPVTSSGASAARFRRNREATASSWRTWPNVKERRREPNVEGA